MHSVKTSREYELRDLSYAHDEQYVVLGHPGLASVAEEQQQQQEARHTPNFSLGMNVAYPHSPDPADISNGQQLPGPPAPSSSHSSSSRGSSAAPSPAACSSPGICSSRGGVAQAKSFCLRFLARELRVVLSAQLANSSADEWALCKSGILPW